MLFFAAVHAPQSPESMKFPVNSLLAGNSGFRDEFAPDCLLQQRVRCELGPGSTREHGAVGMGTQVDIGRVAKLV
jgi:hypothetical protein